jgi:diphosphomevalonate decarboxylase
MILVEAVAVAHPNVALSKYWGKRESGGNAPAVPSLSVTLAGLTTRTRVRWHEGAGTDRVVLGGRELPAGEMVRALALLERVRRAAGVDAWAEVESYNDFPTASGLASSASGFAALALAAVQLRPAGWDAARLSDLARRGSASAARSVFGGFVELPAAPVGAREDELLSARPVAPPDALPLTVLVAVTAEGAKAVGSTSGMRTTMAESPYARAWLEHAPRLHESLRAALEAHDFDRLGELAEASALAMHASAIAAGVVYWNGGTLAALEAVRTLRRAGTGAYASIDAGPHVKVLVRPADAPSATDILASVPGVLRVIEARPGDGARLDASAEGP